METQTETIVTQRVISDTDSSAEVGGDAQCGRKPVYIPRILWPDLASHLFIHGGALYGIYLIILMAHWYTTLCAFAMVYLSGFGITAGAHRLWSHRAYKAKWPLRLLLCFLFTMAGQREVHTWVLDHRVHHKFSETDSDPHDARRGFWFSHVGWLVLTPHPDVVIRRKAVDMSDLDNDPIVLWQKRLYTPLFVIFCLGLPVWIPIYYWNEDWWVSFFVNFNFRYSLTLNVTFAVNSFAHMYGSRPYDKNIGPVENLIVSMGTLGEGWHNYHHVFPWDYKTSELGNYSFNWTTGFIDLFARLGWAYDCKTVSDSMVKRRAAHSGDDSHQWGYGDKEMDEKDRRELDASRLIGRQKNHL